ncbi:MAG: 4Fe-4S binding protein [Bacillus sp. (in: firmicutes)]
MVNGKIEIDVNKCDSCGECITSCPVSAVKGNVPSRTVKNGLLYYEPHYCPTVKELLVFRKCGVKGIAVPGGTLDDSQWVDHIEEANQWLVKLGLEPFYFCRAEELAPPAMSRRDLFTSARKKGKDVAKEMAPAEWRQNPNAWSLPFHYRDVQFFEVQLDLEKCTLCQSCVKLCKQDVFNLSVDAADGGASSLFINHQKCTNCQLCIDVCNEDAVVVAEKVSAKTESAIEVEERTCTRCKKSYLAFSVSEDESKCPVCLRIPSDWLMP